MTYSDRARLGKSILAAVGIHLALAIGTAFMDFSAPLPDYIGPVFVELDIPPPEPVVEPPPPPPPPAPVEPRVEPAPQPAPPPEPQPTPAPSVPAPGAPRPTPRTEAPAEPPRPAHGITQDDVDDFIASIGGSTTDRARPQSPQYTIDEEATAADVPLPVWAGQVMADAGIPTEQMDRADVIQMAQRIQGDPGIREQLQSALAAIDSAPVRRTSGPATQTNDGSTADAPATDLSAGSLTWTRAEGRGGVPSKPRLTAEMFGGSVPARIEFVVIFDVNNRGQVEPGSIVFQSRSGYTRVNEEVRRTVGSWTFQPKPGAPVESAVFTLIVYREDVL